MFRSRFSTVEILSEPNVSQETREDTEQLNSLDEQESQEAASRKWVCYK